MKQEDLNQLIGKYYDGETSMQEEAQLNAYFESDDIPAEHQEAKLYFMATKSLAENVLSDDFDDKLIAQLNIENRKTQIKRWIYSLSSAAAVILLMLSVWVGTDLLSAKEVYGTINDPEIAFAETKKVLDEVSKKMNKGLKPAKQTVSKVEENVNQAGEIKKMKKALKHAKKINKYEDASELLKSISKVQVRIGKS